MKKLITTCRRDLPLFCAGGVIYCVIELLWRAYTHWTMGLAGGLSLVCISRVNAAMRRRPLALRCLAGGGVITGVEFIFGCVVNLLLKWNVWDYSAQSVNLLGQICPLFSALWVLISVPAIWLCNLYENLRAYRRGNDTEKQNV